MCRLCFWGVPEQGWHYLKAPLCKAVCLQAGWTENNSVGMSSRKIEMGCDTGSRTFLVFCSSAPQTHQAAWEKSCPRISFASPPTAPHADGWAPFLAVPAVLWIQGVAGEGLRECCKHFGEQGIVFCSSAMGQHGGSTWELSDKVSVFFFEIRDYRGEFLYLFFQSMFAVVGYSSIILKKAVVLIFFPNYFGEIFFKIIQLFSPTGEDRRPFLSNRH